MKVLRCNDDTYALVADHAARTHLSLAQALNDLVSEKVGSAEYADEVALPIETVREVVREELQRTLGDAWNLRGGVAYWLRGLFGLDMATNANVAALCRAYDIEPALAEKFIDK